MGSTKYLLLLTATPLQNDLGELYNLVTLPTRTAATYSEFRRTFTFDRRSPGIYRSFAVC